MALVSNSPQQPITVVNAIEELSGIATGSLATGDQAAVRQGGGLPMYFALVQESTDPVDGTTVLYTSSSDPLRDGSGPGRWKLLPSSGGGSGSGAGAVIYRQGATPSDNVYPTFPAAYAASEEGSTIIVDGSLGQPVIGPPNTSYDMTLRQLSGPLLIDFGAGNPTTALVEQGVTLPGLNRVSGILTLQSQSTLPIVTVSEPFGTPIPLMFLSEGSTMSGSPTAPFLDISAGGIAAGIVLQLGGQIGDGTNVAVRVGANSGFQVIMEDQGQVQQNAFEGPATAQVNLQVNATSAQYSTTQPNLLNPVQVSLQTAAENLGFQLNGQDDLWNEPTFTNAAPSPGPQVQGALSNLIRREQVFTLRPGDPNPQGMVFPDLPSLLQAIQNTQGAGFPIIEMDQSANGGNPITFGPGLSSLPNNVTIRGNGGFGASPTAIQFGDGVNAANDSAWGITPGLTLENLSITNRNVSISPFEASGPPNTSYVLTLAGFGVLQDGSPPGGGAVPMFGFTASTFDVDVQGRWQIAGGASGGATRFIFTALTNGMTVNLSLASGSSVAPNSLLAQNGGTINVTVDGSTTCSFQQSPAIQNPNMPGAGITYSIGGTFSRSFTAADLGPGPVFSLPINHNLGTRVPLVVGAYSDTGALLGNAGVNVVDENNVTVNLTGFVPGPGVSYTISVQR